MIEETAFIHIKLGQYVSDNTAELEDACNLSRLIAVQMEAH
jgi:hypothetical protein